MSAFWRLVNADGMSVFTVLIAIYCISEMRTGLRRAGAVDRVDDRGSLRLIAIVFTLSWFGAIAALNLVPQAAFRAPWALLAGLVSMIAGQLLRWWSIATLGRLFTVNVAVRPDHKLIESGPYHFVRHPSYLAILLVHLGAALCLGNALSLVILVLPPLAVVLNRIRVEEDVLAKGLGQPYEDYMARTKRLVPGLY